MSRATRRPGVLVRAEEPDGIGGEACRLGGTGDLDGRVAGFGGKEGFVEGAGRARREIPSSACGGHRSPASRRFRRPAASGGRPGTRRSKEALKTDWRRESQRYRATAEPVRPSRVGFAGGAQTRPGGVGLRRMRLTQAAGSRLFGRWTDKGLQGPLGCSRPRRRRVRMCACRAEVSCGLAAAWPVEKQPVEFVLGERAGEPAEQQMRGIRAKQPG